MNPSSKIKSEIEGKLGINLKESSIQIKENLNEAGEAFTELKTYNAVQMASLERSKIDSEEIILKTKPDYYYYPIENLNKDFSKIKKGSIIHICLYSVTLSDYKPFIQYLLFKHSTSDKLLTFPFFTFKGIDLENQCHKKIKSITHEDYEIRGLVSKKNDVFVIASLPDNSCSLQHLTKKSKWWFALLHEIVNERKILYFPIHESVTNLFYYNPDLLYILDENNLPYEAPLGLYNGQHANKTNFIATFGISKYSPMASMGPYYYFATYDLACKFGSWTNSFKPLVLDDILLTDNDFGRYKQGGLVRFAIFTGKVLVLLNRDWDPKDKSPLSSHRDDKEKKLLRVDGSWTKNYDSTCVSEITYSDGSKNQNGAKYCVKNYYQQVPLSYHFLDKKSVPEMHDPKKQIKIK
jgi:hypothetical protein